MPDPIATFLQQVINQRDQWRDEDLKKWKDCGEKEDFSPAQIWFRGVSDKDYKLTPQGYRPTTYELRKFPVKDPDEDEIRYAFKSRALQLMAERHLPTNEKDWYFLMRHYGAPTRLLDWTDGALLALYFAVRELTKPRDAAVWMLDPSWLNEEANDIDGGVRISEWPETDPWFPKPFDEVLHPQWPLAVDPPHVDRRLTVQRGHFTIHGTAKDGLDKMLEKAKPRLVKFIINAGDIVEILDDLGTCGIAETTVFPDLEGLSREIKREWGGM
jgi:hypothetical protein